MYSADQDELLRYVDLKLAALGQPTSARPKDPAFLHLAGPLLRNYHQKDLLLAGKMCPADGRIQDFLESYLAGFEVAKLPANTLVLDRGGLARAMSLPAGEDYFSSPYLKSYRLAQGVLHNPKSDRRTTKGIFHVVEGGMPVPADKITVPKKAFASLLAKALQPPQDVLALPFTANQPERAHMFVSLLLRPLVCPATGTDGARSMETRFFAPGSLVSNLDFVESIFGNAGDPYLPENDAARDSAHWSGHTGCVILAPHLAGVLKKDVGLPHVSEATEIERANGMCWASETEQYNDGNAFKATCRDHRGVIVTIIADNYYGYCKKEVKTQISYATNLFGIAEEEHAGGAIAFPAYVLGQDFHAGRTVLTKAVVYEEAMRLLGDRVELKPGRYAVDKAYPDVYYVPENADFHVREGVVRWPEGHLVLRAGDVYVLPWGTKIRLEKQPGGSVWRLIASRADGVLCHKPCTVSGGGKSEISKSLGSILMRGPVFVGDYHRDIAEVAAILKRDFSGIYREEKDKARAARPILSVQRSLGSVIKLLTPSSEYTDTHNAWVRGLPAPIRQLIVAVKRYYQPEWGDAAGDAWQKYFTVDRINGLLGHELKFDNQKLMGNYLRVGYDPDGSWRIFKLRPDFNPADKVQVEDDITASVVLPRESLTNLEPDYPHKSVKLLQNCEARLFQRPDDAIHRGFDKDAEADLAAPGNFLSNFEPLTQADVQKMLDNVVAFDEFSDPMKKLLGGFATSPSTQFVVSSAQPRIVDGAPSKNPRYLQVRPDLASPREGHLAEMGTRLAREIPADRPVYFPVNAVLAGRRNNPPDAKAGIPNLAVYSPVHYQELPELFMDFICSLTGKSPSTTGFGSEGALTKGPFNALPPVIDVNNALVSAILTGYSGFTTAAGHVGPKYRVDHDNSMLVPELWCRMRIHEREADYLISHGLLERVNDFEFEGRQVLASRLGYRITSTFVDRFLGRIFESPGAVFTDEMLRPEKQGLAAFAEGVDAICEAQQRVSRNYFEDGSVKDACPPVQALLHIMRDGHFEGKDVHSPEVRGMFTREALLGSDWYLDRLKAKQRRDVAFWAAWGDAGQVARVSAPGYLDELVGTIGADPSAVG